MTLKSNLLDFKRYRRPSLRFPTFQEDKNDLKALSNSIPLFRLFAVVIERDLEYHNYLTNENCYHYYNKGNFEVEFSFILTDF